jgi:transposase
MNSLAIQVQEVMHRDPHAGDLYVFRCKRGHLVKILWHDGVGMSLYAKRPERGRFIWSSPGDGGIAISAAQLAYMLDVSPHVRFFRTPTNSCRRLLPQPAGIAEYATTQYHLYSTTWNKPPPCR